MTGCGWAPASTPRSSQHLLVSNLSVCSFLQTSLTSETKGHMSHTPLSSLFSSQVCHLRMRPLRAELKAAQRVRMRRPRATGQASDSSPRLPALSCHLPPGHVCLRTGGGCISRGQCPNLACRPRLDLCRPARHPLLPSGLGLPPPCPLGGICAVTARPPHPSGSPTAPSPTQSRFQLFLLPQNFVFSVSVPRIHISGPCDNTAFLSWLIKLKVSVSPFYFCFFIFFKLYLDGNFYIKG